MFKYLMITCLALGITSFAGCGNLSPRDNLSPQLDQRLDNLEGNQNTLENNQNAIKIELGRLQNHLAVKGENNDVQQGWLNIQADGIIIMIFALTTIGMLLFFIYRSNKYKRTADLLAGQIRAYNDYDLKERVMAAAWNTNLEKQVFKMIE